MSNRRILLVEDNQDNMTLISDVLMSLNYAVIQATNGEQGVEIATSEKPDLILMDLKMPVMDGYESTRQLKRHQITAHIPVIALTASGMKQEELLVLERGFDGFLRKPVLKADLIQEMARFLEHQEQIQPQAPAGFSDSPADLPAALAELDARWDLAKAGEGTGLSGR